MRKPNLKDVFRFSAVLQKVKLRGIDISEDAINSKNMITVGLEIIYNILARISDAEEEIKEFLSGLFECSTDEILEKPLDELVREYEDCMNSAEMIDFFARVDRLMATQRKTLSSPGTEGQQSTSLNGLGGMASA